MPIATEGVVEGKLNDADDEIIIVGLNDWRWQ